MNTDGRFKRQHPSGATISSINRLAVKSIQNKAKQFHEDVSD